MGNINKQQLKFSSPKVQSLVKREDSKYYNKTLWIKLRNSKLRECPLCEECAKNGRVTAAVHVHHVIPFMRGETEEARWRLFTDINNLESVCLACHHDIHKLMHDNK